MVRNKNTWWFKEVMSYYLLVILCGLQHLTTVQPRREREIEEIREGRKRRGGEVGKGGEPEREEKAGEQRPCGQFQQAWVPWDIMAALFWTSMATQHTSILVLARFFGES